MRNLCLTELTEVSGGLQLTHAEPFRSMADFSFVGGILGGIGTAIYGAYTCNTVLATAGRSTFIASTFPTVFMVGLGASWVIGAFAGLIYATANTHFHPITSYAK